MNKGQIIDELYPAPIIAATDKSGWCAAVESEAKVLFHLSANLFYIKNEIKAAKEKGKAVFVHIDLAEGIGKDLSGLMYLKRIGADGIISTKASIIKTADEIGLLTVQRFFALDSKGLKSVREMMEVSHADFIEIMPGVIPKVIEEFKNGGIPIIAGGLIETKAEVTAALSAGATAISTGKEALWSL